MVVMILWSLTTVSLIRTKKRLLLSLCPRTVVRELSPPARKITEQNWYTCTCNALGVLNIHYNFQLDPINSSWDTGTAYFICTLTLWLWQRSKVINNGIHRCIVLNAVYGDYNHMKFEKCRLDNRLSLETTATSSVSSEGQTPMFVSPPTLPLPARYKSTPDPCFSFSLPELALTLASNAALLPRGTAWTTLNFQRSEDNVSE